MKILTIKIGSGTLMTKRNKLDEYRIAHIAEQVAFLQKKGYGVVLVVSGAVACGIKHLESEESEEVRRQAAAGVGQIELMTVIRKVFKAKNLTVAQLLLTAHQLDEVVQREKVRQVLEMYLKANVVTVINENDAVNLNGFGGNDLLVVKIAQLVKAESALILSQMTPSTHGVGGGGTKLEALALLDKAGITGNILNGKDKNVIVNHIL